MQVPHNAMVLVADGRKMLFFRNEGDGEFPNLQVEHAEEQPDLPTREQGSSPAGRASSSHGAANSAVAQTDFHQQSEDRFAVEAAELLKTRALANEFEALIIVAPPKTLGELRKHYHSVVSSRLKGELAKDLTGHPVPDIEAALKAA